MRPLTGSAHIILVTMVFIALSSIANAEDMRGGLIIENPSTYNSFPIRPIFRTALPSKKDLSESFPAPGRQGAQSSCVGWAVGYAARSYYARSKGKAIESVSWPFSPSFIYNLTKLGNCEAGSSISSGLDLLRDVGILSLADFPYNPDDCSKKPTDEQLVHAKNFRIKSWARVDIESLDALKAEINLGNPVIFGMKTTPSFYQLKEGIYSNDNELPSGSHALVLVGFDDQISAFKVINSWGPNWGSGGYGWISYKTFKAAIQNAFVMIADEETQAALIAQSSSEKQAAVLNRLNSWEKEIDCVSIHRSTQLSGESRLLAVVGSTTARDKLRDILDISALNESMDIQIHPWPQCEGLEIFQPLFNHQTGLSVFINEKKDIGLKEGDPVVITVNRSLIRPHLAVLYLQADGSLVKLTSPEQSRSESGSNVIRFGLPPDSLHVTKPLGEEMVIAFESERPLTDLFQKGFGSGRELRLGELREWLQARKQRDPNSLLGIDASYAILHTR